MLLFWPFILIYISIYASFNKRKCEPFFLQQFDRVCCLASRYNGRQMGPPPPLLPPSLDLDMTIYPRNFDEPPPPMGTEMLHLPMMHEEPHNFPGGVLILDEEKSLALELAISSADELAKMCHACEPLWINESGREVVNVEEHMKMFTWSSGMMSNSSSELRIEGTRDAAVVIMNSITLVDAFLDAVSSSWYLSLLYHYVRSFFLIVTTCKFLFLILIFSTLSHKSEIIRKWL